MNVNNMMQQNNSQFKPPGMMMMGNPNGGPGMYPGVGNQGMPFQQMMGGGQGSQM